MCILPSARDWISFFSCSYRRTYRPAPYHIAQELQKYNIPDYRPRQEQCVSSSSISKLLTPLLDSKKQSRRFGRCNVCAVIAVSLSARPRMRDVKTKQSSSERTIHQNRMHGRRGTKHTLSFGLSYMYSIILINSDTMDVMQCAVMKPKSRPPTLAVCYSYLRYPWRGRVL